MRPRKKELGDWCKNGSKEQTFSRYSHKWFSLNALPMKTLVLAIFHCEKSLQLFLYREMYGNIKEELE